MRARAHQRLAARRREQAEHHLEQRRLAHAVAPDDAELLARFEVEFQPVEQRPAIGQIEARVLQLDDAVGHLRRGRDDEVHVEFLLRPGLPGEGVVTVHAVARFGGARGRAAADPFEFALEEFLTPGFLRLGVGHAGGLGFEERGVVALVGDEVAAREFHDAVGDAVEEIPVVRHEDAGAGIILEEVLQPLDGVGVEMVGRLVEDEQIGPGKQRAAECDAAFFPAREAARETVGGGGVEVGDERLDAVAHVPAVEVVDVVEEFVGAGVVGGPGLVFGDEVEHLLRAHEDVVLHGAGVVELEVLRQVAGDEFAAADDLPGVRLGDPGDDAQEGGFARAVASDEADAVALVDGEGGVVEDGLHAVAGGEVVGAEDGVGDGRCAGQMVGRTL